MAENKGVENKQSKKDSKERKPKILGLKPKGAAQWYKGRLCPIRKETAWFMKPMTELPEGYTTTRDVFMYPNYISQFILPVLQGDILEFILSDRDKTKPMAQKVRVSQYMPRTCKELIKYTRTLIEGLNTVDFKKVLVQVMPCTAMWRFLGSPVFKGEQDEEYTTITYVEVLLTLLTLILRLGKPYKTLLQDVIKNVTRGTMFQSTSDQNIAKIIKSCNYADGDRDRFYSEEEEAFLSAELVRSFCHDAIRLSPTVTRCLLPTVNAISEKVANPSTQSFLCDLLSLNSVGENSFVANAGMWIELPLIPTDHELAGHLVERDKHLLPVRTTIPYDNPDQYMDTYFRLVRAETFSAIQHGIKDLKTSQLDLRDMNVYFNIHLAGFELQGGRFSLAIHFTPTKKVKKWEASTQLMYGNLVCISISRKFDDVIWATVSNRDADLLNKHQVIMLELLEENNKSMSEIMIPLQTQGGSAIMVESPTYYHSLSPILRSLKEFDVEDFALQPEIIYARPSREMPSYLIGATCRTSIVCSTKKTANTISEERKDEPEERIPTEERNSYGESPAEESPAEESPAEESPAEESPAEESTEEESSEEESSEEESSEGEDLDSPLNYSFNDEARPSEDCPVTFHKLVEEHFPECSSQCNVEADQPSAETSNEDTGSHEKLGKRMVVERFVEIFNSSSESSLEASQCEALTHALKNKLAIIQGPPGCGKTFIGVKIVQLLLSLKPRLEKPILLLTYKNHALDEFLKHTLKFCDINDLVRIGGRSKEPKLEQCNLKSIQNSISLDKATYIEVQNARNEIIEIEKKIKKISAEVETSSFLTQRSLIEELTEEQIGSLMVEAGWGWQQLSYRINKNKFADKSWIQLLIYNVSQDFGSLKEFLLESMQTRGNKNNYYAVHCISVFQIAFQAWFPNRVELQRMKQFQSEFILQVQSDTTTDNDDETKDSEDGDDDELGDEEHVKQLLEARMGSRYSGGSARDLVLFKTATTKRNDILVEISDYPPDMAVSSQIRSVNNPWSLNEVQRLQFLYCILNEKTTSVSQEMNGLLEQLESLKNRKQELEMNDKVEMLSQKKIIGVTITEASINHDLIHHIGPSVVIVEEAAEILEPSLLAALTPSIEHLILIGDHKQLRPQVDTYELCKNFQLDVSMMERLIESGFPFRSLVKQNRMRPEFSALLHDIYPNLEDNLPLVLKNEPLKCIGESMFFWSHSDPEKYDRTYTNVKEADRIVALVLYLLNNGCPPSEITVLAAYLGQTKLLRHMLKQEKVKRPKLFQETDDREGFVQVQTIDMYQGDENKYVLVSLVRSNNESRIGFLNKMNRRCVAQSRAKCGLYFVGNFNTLVAAKDSCWTELLTAMMQQDCVASQFPLQCVKHVTSKYPATDANSIHEVIASPKLLCMQRCGDPYPECDKHPCKKPCFPPHWHNNCPAIVPDHFPDCGHAVKRRCPERISSLRCNVRIIVDLQCGHEGTKLCHQNVSDVLCMVPVTASFPRCGHSTEKKCYERIESMRCSHLCEEMNSCGIHKCSDICGKVIHKHEQCPEMVDYKFPKCGHPSSKKKKCSEEINWKCQYKVLFTGACGHVIEKKCHQTESEVKCLMDRSNGYDSVYAPRGTAVMNDEFVIFDPDQALPQYIIHFSDTHTVQPPSPKQLSTKAFLRKNIQASRTVNFQDPFVMYYKFAESHFRRMAAKSTPPLAPHEATITSIDIVINKDLEDKFEDTKKKFKSQGIPDDEVLAYRGTDSANIDSILKDNLQLKYARRQAYGKGTYFSEFPRVSLGYGDGLLLCRILPGKEFVDSGRGDIPAGYNSKKVLLRGQAAGAAVANASGKIIIIENSDQILPFFVIHRK